MFITHLIFSGYRKSHYKNIGSSEFCVENDVLCHSRENGNPEQGNRFSFSWETLDSGLRPAGMTALTAIFRSMTETSFYDKNIYNVHSKA